MLDMPPEQIGMLAVLTVSQVAALGVTYWVARQAGWRRGNAHGYRTGYDMAEDKFEAELNEAAARGNSAERLLRATGAELRQSKAHHTRELQNLREAYEAQALRLADAQVLNQSHARLLRQSAGKFEHVAGKLQRIGLDDDARHCLTLCGQLHTLAGWLKPVDGQQERAA